MSDNTNNGFPVPEEPLTREEQYLSAIAGVTASTEIPEKPLTRVEAYLNKIVENGGGGGSSFEPTDEQLAAMNSGITAEDVEQISTNKNNISSFHKVANTEIYFSEVMPTGTITGGSYWISTDGVKIYGDTDNIFDGTVEQGSFDPVTGGDVGSTNRVKTTFMTNPLTAGVYVLSVVGADDTIMYVYNESKQFVSELSIKTWQTLPFTIQLSGTYYIRFGLRKSDNADIVPSEVTSITLIKKNTWH